MRIIISTCAVIVGLALAQPSAGALGQDKPSTAGEKTRAATADAKQKAKDATSKTKDTAEKTGNVLGDAGVTAAVKTKLLADKTVSGLKIDVDTSDGVVTLNGNADTRAEAQRAARIARDTKGVKRVVNNITVANKPAATTGAKPPAKK